MLHKYLAAVVTIVLINILVLNSWSSDPIFVVGPSFSAAHGHFFQNTLAFYEQGFHSTYLYGIYAFLFLIKGMEFVPFKVYQVINIALLIWATFAALKGSKKTSFAPLVVAAMVSSAVLTGPRFETLPITLMMVVVMLLEKHQTLSLIHIATIGLLYAVLPMLHPMATLQGGLLLLLYYMQKDSHEKQKLIAAAGFSLLFFMFFVHFDIHNFLDFYTKGTGSKDLQRHFWRPALTLKFLKLHPLVTLLIAIILLTTRSAKAAAVMGCSLLLGQLLGRSYYGIYVLVFIIYLLPRDGEIALEFVKNRYKWALGGVMALNIAVLLIHPLQALENPGYYKAWNNMLAHAQATIEKHVSGLDENPQVWVGFRLAPGLYEVDNLRYFWEHTPELNGYGHVRPKDVFISTDRRELLTAKRLVRGQSMYLSEITVDSIAAKGLLRTNLKRTPPIRLRIFEVTRDSSSRINL
jgi:hypothetical protein